ncbi:serine/threonine-protein kinase [Wenzhouxiangella marina]|uniref:Protein kinase domain-containing protein n=1 Tax=Wenzhouxiangella marina TaxID=1579979 RepID=A0A0K0XU55_9GAMM|nr:tetratricopeptide repeat protein [Wenzhouxiangella marina]AKS41166.1 hypothetical protein WM2015_785 [Wenzhouxiangella marina]MBB6088045.1 serine/threonine-protein kinase [Wenzhouxiangella marina]
MNRERRIHELFLAALDRPAEDRQDWLAEAAGDDPAVLTEVLALLDADAAATGEQDAIGRIIRDGARALDEASDDPEGGRIGQALGAWRLERHVASGGMGRVFLARRADGEYQALAAIKLLRGFPDDEALARLRRERQILADLDHPNIAGLLDGGSTEDGQPWLAIEWIDGRTIDAWCSDRDLDDRQRVALVIKVCAAVEAAHQRLVVHRDIKPGNVLVGKDGEPKLLDFGIAKLVDDSSAGTATRVRYYTPDFSSPEQVEGRAMTTLSDVYSLGRLLAAVLEAGRPGYRLPSELGAIVERATEAEPAQRYPGARALADDLENWLADRPVQAAAIGTLRRLAKFARRHRAAFATGTAAMLLLLAAGVWIVLENARARAAETEARRAAAQAEQVLTMMTGMIEASRPGAAGGRDLTVAEMLEAGERQQRSIAIDDPALDSRLQLALGEAWKALEEFDPAIERLAEAAAQAREAGDASTAVRALAAQAIVLTWNGRQEEAGAVLESAFADLEDGPAIEPSLRAELLNARGVWAIEDGRPDEARRDLEAALEIRQSIEPDSTAVAATLHTLGIAADRHGQPERALAFLDRALALKLGLRGRLDVSYANTQHVRGMVLRRLGRFDEAAEAMRDMIAIRQALFGDDDPLGNVNANEMANLLHDRGDYGQAIDFYRRAITADRRNQDDAPGDSEWIYLNNLAAAHEDRGDFRTAVGLLEQSIALRAAKFGDEHLNTVRAQDNLSRVLISLGEFERAESLNGRVVDQRRQQLGPDHPDVRIARLRGLRIAAERQPTDAAAVRAYVGAVEAWLSDQPATGSRALAQRGHAGRLLIGIGELDRARGHLRAASSGYRSALAEDHPRAAELELHLARIDRLEGRREAAEARLAAARPILQQRLAATAPALDLLASLEGSDAGD